MKLSLILAGAAGYVTLGVGFAYAGIVLNRSWVGAKPPYIGAAMAGALWPVAAVIGIWTKGGKTSAAWLNKEEGAIALVMDLMCVEGLMRRSA